MNKSNTPYWWDEDDFVIAGILHCSPVTDAERQAARQKLLSKISPSGRAAAWTAASIPADEELVSSASQSSSVPRLTEPGKSLSRMANRRNWIAVAALASTVLLGMFWWRANSLLTTEHLVFVCDRILAQDNNWQIPDGGTDRVDGEVISEALRKFLTVYPDGEMQTCLLNRSEIAPSGRLWKIPLARGTELYVFVFQSPRNIKNIDSRLRLVTGSSLGWSTAAAQSNEKLLVFVSRDDLRRSLRFMPLA